MSRICTTLAVFIRYRSFFSSGAYLYSKILLSSNVQNHRGFLNHFSFLSIESQKTRMLVENSITYCWTNVIHLFIFIRNQNTRTQDGIHCITQWIQLSVQEGCYTYPPTFQYSPYGLHAKYCSTFYFHCRRTWSLFDTNCTRINRHIARNRGYSGSCACIRI